MIRIISALCLTLCFVACESENNIGTCEKTCNSDEACQWGTCTKQATTIFVEFGLKDEVVYLETNGFQTILTDGTFNSASVVPIPLCDTLQVWSTTETGFMDCGFMKGRVKIYSSYDVWKVETLPPDKCQNGVMYFYPPTLGCPKYE